ncbi:MAG TPA: hypothetical protein IAC66_00860 [Candidatus Aphodousia gallistercoris]|nr:hypothetical protein [Candidatus Aphodousia gallistercoris]
MDWLDLLAEWILFPLIVVYGFVSWAKDNPGKSLLEGFGKEDEKKKKTPAEASEKKPPTDKTDAR